MSEAGSSTERAPSAIQVDWPAVLRWLQLGWQDLWTQPFPSLIYGFVVFAVSWVVVISLFSFDLSAYLFPALAGFLIVGPILALGLYDKSRRIEGGENITFKSMLTFRPKSATQILFSGVLLCMLMLLWMRAAVLLYALFFGLLPFAGLTDILPVIFGTIEGWGLLIVGTAVGGVFAAFAYAISVFAIPMLYDQQTDVFTAMALSLNTVWNHLNVMLPWCIAITAFAVANVLSGFVLMVIIFPLLGHATWHVYREVCDLSKLEE